jgi:hypothetical protein
MMNGSRQVPAAKLVEQGEQNLREPADRRCRFAGMGVREPIAELDLAFLQHDLAELYLPEDVGVVYEFEAQQTDEHDG